MVEPAPAEASAEAAAAAAMEGADQGEFGGVGPNCATWPSVTENLLEAGTWPTVWSNPVCYVGEAGAEPEDQLIARIDTLTAALGGVPRTAEEAAEEHAPGEATGDGFVAAMRAFQAEAVDGVSQLQAAAAELEIGMAALAEYFGEMPTQAPWVLQTLAKFMGQYEQSVHANAKLNAGTEAKAKAAAARAKESAAKKVEARKAEKAKAEKAAANEAAGTQ